jgi:hypothetical protein
MVDGRWLMIDDERVGIAQHSMMMILPVEVIDGGDGGGGGEVEDPGLCRSCNQAQHMYSNVCHRVNHSGPDSRDEGGNL